MNLSPFRVVTMAAVIGIGLSVARGDFAEQTFSEAVGITAAVILGLVAYFGLIHYLLKGWDRLWASLKRRVR